SPSTSSGRTGRPQGPLFVGLDIGTSGVKAAVVDTGGTVVALATAPCEVQRPKPGHVEQDPEEYWSAAARCILQALRAPGVEAGRVAAVASCGHAPTLVLLDRGGAPVRAAIVWQDTRAVAEAEALAADPGQAQLTEWLGVRWPVDASMPAARFAWLRRHEPEVLSRVATALLPKDYVHLRLTGEAASDAWSAKGLVHQRTLKPVAALLERVGVSPSVAPRTYQADGVVGRVHAAGAEATGLSAGIPVVAGWTDAMAAMLGTGALGRAGLACDVSGTSEVIGLTSNGLPGDTGPLMAASILDSGRWMVYGPTQASNGSLVWAQRTLGIDNLPRALAEAEALPGEREVVFLPYLQGERAPLWDPRARGAFFGLSVEHGPTHLVRAVLDGVACSVRHVLSAAEAACGGRALEVRVAGGGARMAAWNRIKATACGRAFRPCRTSENGALGAAMLAALGSGTFMDVRSASDAMVQLEEPVLPDERQREGYDRLFERYVALWPRVRDLVTRS
ncbi:MAG TPA: FGGY family carbohydrate kinase, partial [Chloroflexota bacterium]|nr:FGGY family carbohydrate kinase [Chloroflexota bacterium]